MAKDGNFAGWVAYLRTGLEPGAPWMADQQSRDDFLVEMIDKGYRRGCLDTATANRLAEHFELVDRWGRMARSWQV